MIRCKECGKIIKGWYWNKYFQSGEDANGLPVYKLRPVCNECAASMIDERTANGLLSAYEE